MPTLADLRSRTSSTRGLRPATKPKDEALVVDRRGSLRPAHLVEQKLRVALLRSKH